MPGPKVIATLWKDYIAPILRRPARFQVAALCYRMRDGAPEVLLVTSQETAESPAGRNKHILLFDSRIVCQCYCEV